MVISKLNIGMSIKLMREHKKMSQLTLAERSQIAQSTLSYIEAGKKSPTFETLSAIAKGLEVSIMELLNFAAIDENNAIHKHLLRNVSPDSINILSDQDLTNIQQISQLLYADYREKTSPVFNDNEEDPDA